MKRQRLSRADSRERTAQRLLDAAGRLIARQGLDATSVEGIAEAAGYTRGAFYSNFRSKGDLLLALLRRDEQRTQARFTVALEEAWRPTQALAQIQQLLVGQHGDRDSFLLWTEGRMLSARNTGFRMKFASLFAERCNFVVKLIETLHRRAGKAPGIALEALAMGFISLSEGVRLFLVSCPGEMPPSVAESILQYFIDAVMPLQAVLGDL